MSTLPIEATEPESAATSITNDEIIKKEGDGIDSADKSAVVDDVPNKESNGSTEAVDVKAEKSEENGDSAATKDEKPENLRTYENGVLKTSAEQVEGVNNSKYDPSVLEESDDPQKIRNQVEFYFGDSNLESDKYMLKLTGGNKNLPVPVQKILEFKRMRRFVQSAIVPALKESKFLEISGLEGEETLKRKVAFDPSPKNKNLIDARSVYVKGFGDEEPSSQFDIEAFFATYGPTRSVRLRRTDDKLFKGSVFVEFQDEETAKKFLELESKPLWKGKHVLLIHSKAEYCSIKNQEIHEGKIDAKPHRGGSRGRGRGGRGNDRSRGDHRGARERNDRGDRDPDDWKKRREEDRASGFRENRSRGNGRANRDRGRGPRPDRGPKRNDRNQERERKNKESNTSNKDDEKVEIKSEVKESPKNENKRAREEDREEVPAKKVKSEVAAEAS